MMTWSEADSSASWPDPPGWDPTPCCGSHALLPVVYPLARLRVRPGLWRGLLFGLPVSCGLWAALLVPLILWGPL